MSSENKSRHVVIPAGPRNPKLGEAVRLRVFADDVNLIKTVSARTAMSEDTVKRHALHDGLQRWLSELTPKAA